LQETRAHRLPLPAVACRCLTILSLPPADPLIPFHYSVKNQTGKALCKAKVQEALVRARPLLPSSHSPLAVSRVPS
jgi:hypothetical protein